MVNTDTSSKANLIKRKIFTLHLDNFWSVAGFSLILLGLSFAIYLPDLGYYLDDWPQLYSLVVHGADGIKNYFLYDDRPFGWWPDLIIFKIWGTNPIGWHVTNYMLRWSVGLVIWGIFSQVWPAHKREVFWMVILYSVYPLFNQQSMGLTFLNHWATYFLSVLSICLMVISVKGKKYRLILLLLSLAVNTVNLFTLEYFIGLELIRPVVLWLVIENQNKKIRVKQTLLYWLPFLGLTIFYVIWRVFLMENIRGLDPLFFTNLLKQPVDTLLQLTNFFFRDTLFVFLTSWFPTIDVSIIDFNVPNLIIGMLLIFSIFFSFMVFLKSGKNQPQDGVSENADHFPLQALVVGFLGVVFGLMPGWLILRSVTLPGMWNDRFGLPGMWAAPIFIVGLLTILFRENRLKREIIVVLLISLAVGHNFRITNDYKWSTTWQQRFFSQLKWRVPELKANTSILADNELFSKVGEYPTSFMLNIFYPSEQVSPNLDHWFFTIHKFFPNVEDLGTGFEVKVEKWYSVYKANSQDNLVIRWIPDPGSCLWVLSSNDRYNPLISNNTKRALPVSNLSLIQTDQPTSWPDAYLFGEENRDTWCYYYETADLARQQSRWNDVIDLYEKAEAKGYHARNGVELMPFIEGYARTGKADVAMTLTNHAATITPHLREYLCDNWNRISKEMASDPIFLQEYQTFSDRELCHEVK